jgi:hypothetical protein
MTSSPPTARDSGPPPVPRISEPAFRAAAREESLLFFCVEDAPRDACRTESVADGLCFRTTLASRIVSTAPEELVLEGATRVRHLLPSSVDLAPLAGHAMQIEISQRYGKRGRATIDAQIRDSKGRLLLWARDGRWPADKEAQGLALRATFAVDGAPRLAIAHAGGVSSIGAPDLARVRTAEGWFEMLVLRLGAEDVAFVLVRR